MTGYLVLLRCAMDDLPIRLFEDKEEAVKFASDPAAVEAEAEQIAGQVFDSDLTMPVAVAVLFVEEGTPKELVFSSSADPSAD